MFSSFFSWLGNRKRSKETLKDRLELVLAYDRAKIPPGKVEALRNDLLEVVNRYFPSGNSQVDIEQEGDKVMLMASVDIDELSRGGSVKKPDEAKEKEADKSANAKKDDVDGKNDSASKSAAKDPDTIESALDQLDPKPKSVTTSETTEKKSKNDQNISTEGKDGTTETNTGARVSAKARIKSSNSQRGRKKD